MSLIVKIYTQATFLYLILFYPIFFFFFLMIRRPPRSTLFPLHDALPISGALRRRRRAVRRAADRDRSRTEVAAALERSEEHTSELQSPCNLVCRLLLEKKKNPQRSNLPSMPFSTPSVADPSIHQISIYIA